jgi:hypothetical protein
MSLEKAIEEIKKMFWGVLKGKFNPDEEEEVKAHLITNLATLTSYAKTCLPSEQQEEYEEHFKKAKDALLKFDSAGPWFRELPEMIDTVYNIITHANMLQIEYHRFSGEGDDAVQFFQSKLETIEMSVASLNEDLKKIKIQMETILQLQGQKIQEPLEKEKPPQVEVSDEIEPEIEVEAKPEEIIEEEIEPEEPDKEEPEEEEEITEDTQELIEGIELASQYEFDQEPFMQTIESEQESLKKLANMLSALDPGDDTVISPLTEKLMAIGDDDEITISEEPALIDEGLSAAELEEVQEFNRSVSRISKVLSTPNYEEDAAKFVSSIKETIAHVSQEKDLEAGEKSALTKIIEEETGEVEKAPVQTDDIQNIIKHLESKRQKAIERIQQLEKALNSEKIDEEEWQELRIKAERHMLRVEDTLDGYKRYLEKLRSQDIGS